jgi:hypothetical protein
VPVAVNRNGNYGGPVVTQKYKPLDGVLYPAGDAPIHRKLLTNRATLLRSAGILGQPLDLAVPSWANAAAAEIGHLPPLVVVSSNRAGWIRAGIDASVAQAQALGVPAFANESDLTALTAIDGQTVSPPMYAPNRIGANRNVYIVVHTSEYAAYRKALAPPAPVPAGWPTVVGWQFKKNGGPKGVSLVGFGASRFAAMEFCKQLRRQAIAVPPGGNATWDYAWLLDDNVVAFGVFAGFAATEAAITANDACAGFRGGTKAETQVDNVTWANDQINGGFGAAAAALPPPDAAGLVQQAALWNVAYFTQNHLNFGPAYIASAEDVSISQYFTTRQIPFKWYGGVKVRKEVPDHDRKQTKLNTARASLAAWVAGAEAATTAAPGAQAPPPLEVQPINNDDGGVQTLATFIVARALPQAAAVNGNDVGVQNTAKCQGVEQLTAEAIEAGLMAGHPGLPALTATFQINGAADQTVTRSDVP